MGLFGLTKDKEEKADKTAENAVDKATAVKAAPAAKKSAQNSVKKAPLKKKATVKKSAPKAVSGPKNTAAVLLRPRITEKATDGFDAGVYVFEVSPRTNKKEIAAAIESIYKVRPVKVHIAQIKSKNVMNRRTGVKGVKSGGKKAYVYLKKGDTISLM